MHVAPRPLDDPHLPKTKTGINHLGEDQDRHKLNLRQACIQVMNRIECARGWWQNRFYWSGIQSKATSYMQKTLIRAIHFGTVVPLFFASLSHAIESDGDKIEFFESKIRPVLVEHCYECHNSSDSAESDLALDFRQTFLW